ncbi:MULTISPECIES: DUF899 domain-containing protein [unclassified Mycolicibacterium]|uniref:DUF899 domain-containing protein n=1 Tax=unclassified Mycolicibacterium TaxID=2636767 RepID=UPI0012DD433B|nr:MULTISPECIES: DUF899 domain-containing protein [unclassified Mycolicibacterium]MUL82063.1 DUF899 domain-containing protein [Mycolicibacterium sp. CBMA 329]MUL87829.1 DUF899 domain-containing protein [Mycolicibacterium sp. CBMA 331]MUM01653.1 DUF899 domain-containing protein [Mycolicibacterium sp. CBMA 334]MUM25515.1 DUF899 domain-containing protein [Mycolicibacterium sp. CBMA 295]MUM38126.1 DUF899 domain-containing protein [Mycolicibacterium sp. CBMA 247]
MTTPKIVTREQWLTARRELLKIEKEHTRAGDRLAEHRRALPMVEVDTEYIFDGPDGPVTLRGLFNDHRQLIVYHFMFEPDWDEGCPSCSYLADNFTGALLHLSARDTAFAVVSRAPTEKLTTFAARMGWTFGWYSSSHTSFNDDFAVTVNPDSGAVTYNYQPAADLLASGKIWVERGELPGLSVFLRDDERIFHTYSTYQRGLDHLINTYNYLDLTPLGRGADDQEPHSMAWVRYHDQYAT